MGIKNLKNQNEVLLCEEVFNNSPDGLLLVDISSGRIIKSNEEAERMFLLSEEDLHKKYYSDLFQLNEEIKEKNISNLDELDTPTNLTRKFDNIIIQSDGEELPVEVALRVILVKGELCQIVSLRDIKERKIYEKKLLEAKKHSEELQQLKINFLANISHELRTPLISILGYSEILKEEIKDETLYEMVSGIHRGGTRLLETLSLILDLTLLKSKDVSFRESLINPIYTINELFTLYEPKIKAKNLILKKEIFAKNCFINVDARMYFEIIKSLFDNAVKYTERGKITVRVTTNFIDEKEYVKISIKDTGIGIDSDQLDMIFEDFRQASEGTTRDYQGAGVGLTIAKRFTEFNKGLIDVKSTYREGSEFTVCFPLFVDEQQVELSFESKEDENLDGEKPILLFEAHPSTTEIIKLTVGDICKVYSTKTIFEIKKALEDKVFEMIIIDVDRNNFYEVLYLLDELKQLDRCKIKVAILPDYDRLEVEELSKRGISFTYYKPLGKESFRDFVKHFLSV